MEIAIEEARASIVYQHLVRIIVPRPIAWVSTRSSLGVTNLAPFSFFTGVGSRPPSLLFCPANRLDGQPKDTLRNLCETGEFTVNVVPEQMAQAMNQTSADLAEDESEFDAFGVQAAPGSRVQVPRVAGSPVSLECRLMQHIALDPGPGGANIVIGRIIYAHLDDAVLDGSGFVDGELLQAVGRMGGNRYTRTQDTFEIPRPVGGSAR